MDLTELIPGLKATLNPPGTQFFVASETEWTEALANAFWWGRMRGYFKSYRVDPDRTRIDPINNADEMPMEVAQIVVAIAALNALEAKILSLPTSQRAKAGPVEAETQRSAQVLVELLRAKRRELDQMKVELLGSPYAVEVGVIDAVIAREGAYMRGEMAWVS